MNTVGTEKYSKKQCERVVINLEIGDEVIPIKALSFPLLCSPISRNVDISIYTHMQGLKLADSFTESNKAIDLALGIDYCHMIVQGKVCNGSEGPVAVKSKLGWLLSGHVNNIEHDFTLTNNDISNLVQDFLPSRSEVENGNIELIESLNNFWKHESSGLVEKEAGNTKHNDKNATKIDIQQKEGCYSVSLP